MQWQSESKINKYFYMKIKGYREKRNVQRKIAQCGMATFIWQFKGNIKHSTSCSNATISYLVAEIESGFKVIHPKYSKFCPYLLAVTMNCGCSKILNHGLNQPASAAAWAVKAVHRRGLKTVLAQTAEIKKCLVIFIVFFKFEIENAGGDGFNHFFLFWYIICLYRLIRSYTLTKILVAVHSDCGHLSPTSITPD